MVQLTQFLLTNQQVAGAFAYEIYNSQNSVSNLHQSLAARRETVAKTDKGSVRVRANVFPIRPNLTGRPLYSALASNLITNAA